MGQFNHTLILFLFVALCVTCSSHAAPLIERVSFSGYGRSGFQIGKGLNMGEALYTEGFASHNRLQETQYFEFTSKVQLPENSLFVLSVGNFGSTYPYTNQWPGPGFAVTNLYFEIPKLPNANQYSVWFGSRAYRGDELYLFDIWPVDDQNMMGGGLMYHNAERTSLDWELAFGARNEASYELGSDALPSTSLTSHRAHRFIFINKWMTPVERSERLKINVEAQFLPKSEASYTTSAYGIQSVDIPAAYGAGFAIQKDLWKNNRTFLRYGWGDLTGTIETKKASLGPLPTKTGILIDQSGLASRKFGQSWAVGISNVYEFASEEMGILYGAIAEFTKPRHRPYGSATSIAIRPMFYLSRHVHAGFETDFTYYFRSLDPGDITYGEISPMIEYAINQNAIGTPKFRAVASQAFYARPVTKYDDWVKTAFNFSLGFEIWF